MTGSRPEVASGRPLVGREREWSELSEAPAAARSGHGCLFLLRGQAGIGKKRLAEQLGREAEDQGQRVHWGRCVEGAATPAFWPWVEVIRSIAASGDPPLSPRRRKRSSPASPGSPRISSGPASPARGSRADPSSALPSFDAEIERFQLFDGVASFLRRLASRAPYGIVLDDLHAADLPSLSLLAFMARQLNTAPIWVVGTYREVEARADPGRRELLSVIARLGRSLTLSGLSEPEVGRLIEQVIGTAPSRQLVARIRDLSDGNPFFVDELARLFGSRPEGALRERAAGHLTIGVGIHEVCASTCAVSVRNACRCCGWRRRSGRR